MNPFHPSFECQKCHNKIHSRLSKPARWVIGSYVAVWIVGLVNDFLPQTAQTIFLERQDMLASILGGVCFVSIIIWAIYFFKLTNLPLPCPSCGYTPEENLSTPREKTTIPLTKKDLHQIWILLGIILSVISIVKYFK